MTKEQREIIREVIEAAKMTRASFMRKGYHIDPERERYTNEIREATELYRESWIIGPLEELLNDAPTQVGNASWRASIKEENGEVKHFYGATPEEADAKLQAYLEAANENPPSTKTIDSSNYMGADRE